MVHSAGSDARSIIAMDEIGAGVFGFDVGLQLLRLREIFAAQMALGSTSVGIGRASVRPMHVQIGRSQETLVAEVADVFS